MIETKFKDWHNVTIGNLGSTYNGLTGKKASDFGHGVAKYVPFINVIYNPIIDVNSLCCVDVKPSEYQNAVIKGDLLFNTSSETPEEVAMCSYVDTDIQNLYLNSFCFGFRLNDSNVSGLFLSYLFRSKFGRSLMLELAQGSTRYNLQKKKFLQTELHIPQILAEQERIAEALSDVDALIKELDALIEKKRMVLKATMQDLLTARRRLPGFSEPWIVKTIDEICFRFDNLRIPVAEKMREKGSTPYYGANGIQGYVKGFTHNGEFILLAEDGANNLKDYPIQYVKGKIWVNNHAHVLSANENYATTRFLSFSLKCIDYEKAIVGGSRAKLNSSTLMLLNVYIPTSLSEQQAIAEILSDMDAEIAELEKKKEKYTSIRQGMMQQLLTGKIRLI